MSGWIKLHRKILDSRYGCNLEMSGLFDRLLLMANHKEGFTADGTKINPGQFMTSQDSLAKKFTVDRNKMRRMLSKLESAQQIAQQTSAKNTIITIVNWHLYQGDEQQSEHQVNIRRTSDEHQVNTNKNNKNNKNNISAEFTHDFFEGVIEVPKKNLPKTKPQDFSKSKGPKKSPLEFLFSPEDEIQSWLAAPKASINVQNELLENYSHHMLRDEVKTAYQWTLERKPSHAGLFLKNWMRNKPKKAAYGFDSEEDRIQAARELYKKQFGVYPEVDQGVSA